MKKWKMSHSIQIQSSRFNHHHATFHNPLSNQILWCTLQYDSPRVQISHQAFGLFLSMVSNTQIYCSYFENTNWDELICEKVCIEVDTISRKWVLYRVSFPKAWFCSSEYGEDFTPKQRLSLEIWLYLPPKHWDQIIKLCMDHRVKSLKRLRL